MVNNILINVFWFLVPIVVYLTFKIMWRAFCYCRFVWCFVKDDGFYIVSVPGDEEYRLFGMNTDFLYMRGTKEQVIYLQSHFLDIKNKTKKDS